jgi:hypothetical protein
MRYALRLVMVLLPTILVINPMPCTLSAQDVSSIRPGKNYKSPLGDFEIKAPELCLGTKIQQQHDDTGGMVAFFSDVGQLERIDFARLDPSAVTTLAEADSAVVHTVYAEHLNSTIIQPNDAVLLVTEPMKAGQTESLFAVAQIPGGGVLESVQFRDGKMVSERVDSVRGLLVFARAGVIYVLHHEVGIDFDAIWDCGLSGQGGPQLTAEERDREARKGVQQLYASIRFR